jgi:hypothetical protein
MMGNHREMFPLLDAQIFGAREIANIDQIGFDHLTDRLPGISVDYSRGDGAKQKLGEAMGDKAEFAKR